MNRRLLVRFVARRLAQALVIIAGIAIVNFFLLHLAHGDAADVLAAQSGGGNAGYLAQLRATYGLDQPLPVQLGLFFWRLVHLDFGTSTLAGTTVTSLIFGRLPATVLLMTTSLLFAVVLAIVFGVTAARYAHRLPDRIISFVALVFYATPAFWLGLMLIVIFSVKLGWLPTGGIRDLTHEAQGLGAVVDVARHLVLPALTLSFFFLAVLTRLTRSEMIEVYGLEFIRLARAKGLSELRVAYVHVLRNALLPLVTVVGVQIASFLGGSVLIETVFSWPGLGRLMFEAVFARDLNVLLGILLLSSIVVVVTNLLVDLAYVALDPRIELAA